MIYILMYLVAIVAANLSVAYFGPSATIVNAFLFIGLDLTARDKLHDQWHNDRLVLRMGALVLAGSVITVILNMGAMRIAVASTLAFAAAALVDTLVYQKMYARPRLVKMNGSNVFSAATDSIIFPAVAFGFPLMWWIMLGQFAAKVLGGLFWSLLIVRATRQEVELALTE